MKQKAQILGCLLGGCLAIGTAWTARAATYVTVNPSASWLGYMNVFELPANGGGYVFGSPWGTADLPATFSGAVLTLAPNSIGDPSPFWYIGGGGPGAPGNKIMEANMYVETHGGLLGGQTVTFEFSVLANTFTPAHTAYGFIRDFAPDYSSFNQAIIAITTPGDYSISLNTLPDPARHVQYGFQTKGVNVWITDVAPYGFVKITAIPEPSALLLGGLGLGLLSLGARRRGATVAN
ncbi:MAG: hypothetical protein N3I86_06480 [Verrucomicrobiae bacterium]|nr:hypothetical protein [Verrucomicrobiae bacterium]